MVVGKVEAGGDGRKDRPQLHAVKLHAGIPLDELEAGQSAHEIVVPEGTAHLAVGDRLQADAFLHGDHVPDGLVFNRLQFVTGAETIRPEALRVIADTRLMDMVRP